MKGKIITSRITKALIFYTKSHGNILLKGGFNMMRENKRL